MSGMLGPPPLAPVDVKMHHPFRDGDTKGERHGHTHKNHGNQRTDSVQTRMLQTTEMHVPGAVRQHALGLQVKVGKQMLCLQQEQQDQNKGDWVGQKVPFTYLLASP